MMSEMVESDKASSLQSRLLTRDMPRETWNKNSAVSLPPSK